MVRDAEQIWSNCADALRKYCQADRDAYSAIGAPCPVRGFIEPSPAVTMVGLSRVPETAPSSRTLAMSSVPGTGALWPLCVRGRCRNMLMLSVTQYCEQPKTRLGAGC